LILHHAARPDKTFLNRLACGYNHLLFPNRFISVLSATLPQSGYFWIARDPPEIHRMKAKERAAQLNLPLGTADINS
jgi:hypothetical protein